MLRVLHPVDEITADDFRYVRKWKIWANYESRSLLLAEDLLVALRSADMLALVHRYEVCQDNKNKNVKTDDIHKKMTCYC